MDGDACWMRMDAAAEAYDTPACSVQTEIMKQDLAFHSHNFPCSLSYPLQRLQGVTSTMADAAMSAPRFLNLISAAVPEGWSWEKIKAHARVGACL